MIVTYRQKQKRPKPVKAHLQITGAEIVIARKPKRYQRKLVEMAPDPDGQERVRQFYERMGLGKRYADTVDLP